MEFIVAARRLARTRDDPIEHTVFRGGGLRIRGFKTISAALFHRLLREHGKRCEYTTDGAGDTLVLDVFSDAPSHSARPTLATNTFPSISEINAGAVRTTTYGHTNGLTSEIVTNHLDGNCVIDVYISASTFSVAVATPSLIVDGVNDILRLKGKCRKCRPPPTVRRAKSMLRLALIKHGRSMQLN